MQWLPSESRLGTNSAEEEYALNLWEIGHLLNHDSSFTCLGVRAFWWAALCHSDLLICLDIDTPYVTSSLSLFHAFNGLESRFRGNQEWGCCPIN